MLQIKFKEKLYIIYTKKHTENEREKQ